MANQQISSLIKFKNSQQDNTTGTLVQITRNTVVMEVYNPHSIVQLSEVLNDLHIRREKQTIYKGRAVVNSLVNTGLMLIVSATLIDPWQDLAEILTDNQAIDTEIQRFITDYTKTHELNQDFQLSVINIRSFLHELNRWLEQLDFNHEDESNHISTQISIIEKIHPHLLDTIHGLFADFEQKAQQIKKVDIIYHKLFAQQHLHSLLLCAPGPRRVYDKPLGYAGDYEMMNMMQRSPIEGANVYASIINKEFIDFAISKSVSNRTDTLVNYLQQETTRVKNQGEKFSSISIACGPALELQRFVRNSELSEDCEFNLIDFDDNALNYAQEKIKESAHDAKRFISLRAKKESVHILLKNSAKNKMGEHDEQHDLVYCSGLFDYLSDKVCTRLLELFYQWVKPGGMIYITNMHTSNPNQQMMEYIMEWFLIYRNEEQMRTMAPHLGTQRISYDKTGVNIGLEIRKPL